MAVDWDAVGKSRVVWGVAMVLGAQSPADMMSWPVTIGPHHLGTAGGLLAVLGSVFGIWGRAKAKRSFIK